MPRKIVLSTKCNSLFFPDHIIQDLLSRHPEYLEPLSEAESVSFKTADGALDPFFKGSAIVVGGSVYFVSADLPRDLPWLVSTVENNPEGLPHLKVIEIPEDVQWHLHVTDQGEEWIGENHRTWSVTGEGYVGRLE